MAIKAITKQGGGSATAGRSRLENKILRFFYTKSNFQF